MKRLAALWLCVSSIAFAQEPLTVETVVSDRKLWPKEITVSVAHEVPIVINGKASGSMKANPGRSYPVRSITVSAVTVDALGSALTFAPADTDLLARAEKQKEQQAALRRCYSGTGPRPAGRHASCQTFRDAGASHKCHGGAALRQARDIQRQEI